MIRITVDTVQEFEKMEHAMDLPSLAAIEYNLVYFDPSIVPTGQTIGAGRTRTVQAGVPNAEPVSTEPPHPYTR